MPDLDLDDDYYDDQNPPPVTERDIRPEDIPADADPVCGKCKQLAEWDGQGWRHAEAAAMLFCSVLFGRSLPVTQKAAYPEDDCDCALCNALAGELTEEEDSEDA